jgi:hypothetical protein
MARTLKKIKRKNKKNSRKRKYQTGGSDENLLYTPEQKKSHRETNAPVKKQQSLTLNNVELIGGISANGTIYKFTENDSSIFNFIKDESHVHYIMKTSKDAFSDNLLYEYVVGIYLNSLKNKYDCFVQTYDLYLLEDNSLNKLKTLDNSNTKTLNVDIVAKNLDLPVMELLFTKDSNKDKKNNNYVDQEIGHHMCDKNTNFALVQEYIEDGKNFLSYFVGEKNTRKIEYKSLDFYLILYQIYKPLCELQDKFSHNDLHMNNIMIKELKVEKTIKIDEIEYPCQYQPYIIDYGRCFFKTNLQNVKDSKGFWDSINEELFKVDGITKENYFNILAHCGMKQIPYNYKPDIRLYNTLFTDTNLTNLDDILKAIVKGIQKPRTKKRNFSSIDPNEPPPIPPIKN